MSDITLGQILPNDGEEIRDAVHVAVIKARAGATLRRGDPVILQHGEALLVGIDLAIGVVDPFLKGYVSRGEYFFVVLKPGSVSNLRHTWTHPLLVDEVNPNYLGEEDNEYVSCRGC